MNEHAEIADMIRELTQPYTHTEPYWTRRRRRDQLHTHQATHPSLLNQLRHTWRNTVGDEPGSGIAASKPPMALGALQVLLRIEAASADWVSRMLELPLRDTAEANLHLLAGQTRNVAAVGLADHIERWWRWARVESQWDGRPRDLRDPCPYCGERMLRVAWDVSAAWCGECGTSWGAAEVGLLGDILREQRMLSSHP